MNIMICTSSRDEVPEEFLRLADDISKRVSKLKFNLIFGAASTGMMGKTATNFKNVSSYTVEKYKEDLKNIPSTKEYILETTFDRTKEMYKDADVILLLPGGTGTVAELFSILEENRSIKKPKSFIIYNYKGYYNSLLDFIDKAINNGFNDNSLRDYFLVLEDTEEIIEVLKDIKN